MKTKKIISLLLAILMTLSLSSVFVTAADTDTADYSIVSMNTAPNVDGIVAKKEYGGPIMEFTPSTVSNISGGKYSNKDTSKTQTAKIYMTYDSDYLYLAATLTNSKADAYDSVTSNSTHRGMFAITVSKYDAENKVVQKDDADYFNYFRVYAKESLGVLRRSYIAAVKQGDTRTLQSKANFKDGTNNFEMKIKLSEIPGFENGRSAGEMLALTVRLADTADTSSTASKYYTLGGDAATSFSTRDAHADGVLKIGFNEGYSSTNTLAGMPASAPVRNGEIGSTEYGDPIIVTSPQHVYNIAENSTYTNNDMSWHGEQQAKVYMTNDKDYLYVAATLDHATDNTNSTGSNYAALMTVTLSRYDEIGKAYQNAEGFDQYLVTRCRFAFGTNTAEKVPYIATVTDAKDNQSGQNGSGTFRPTGVQGVSVVGAFADGVYTYEMRIPWSVIPGMEDGVYTDKKLAATIRIADGCNEELKQNYYCLGGDAAVDFSKVDVHADGVLVLTPNTYDANDADLVENTAYSFMNADTGREIAVGEMTEFTAVAAGENFWNLKAGEQYLDLTGSAPVLGDTPVAYVINKVANERYQIRVAGAYVRDTDDGAGTAVTLKKEAAISTISSGWYITVSGEEKPLRIMPVGDSITWGIVSAKDGETRDYGWRNELSEDLMDYFGRVVFVGSRIDGEQSTIKTKALYRNEGHPGWTINADLAAKDNSTDKGDPDGTKTQSMRAISTAVAEKYNPDIVLLMLGINDVAWLGGNNADGKEATTDELMDLHEEYKLLVKELAANMDENDTVFCSTLTPAPRADLVGAEVKFNELLAGTVGDLNNELDCSVCINDNYAAFGGSNEGNSKDELHLNSTGDAWVANQYGQSIRAMYNADSSVKAVVVTTANLASTLEDAAEGAIIVLGENITVDDVLTVPPTVTLDLNGKTLTVTKFNAYGDVVDTTLGQGGIAVAGDEPFFNLKQDNSMIALFDEGFGYRFFSYKFDYKAVETDDEDSVKFKIRLDLPTANAYALLDNEANYDTFFIKLNLSNSKGPCPPIDHVFTKDTMKTYVKCSSADVTKKYGITLTVYGMSSLADTDYIFKGADACLKFADVTLQYECN